MSKASVCGVEIRRNAIRVGFVPFFELDLCKKYAALAADTNTAHKKYCTPQTKYEMGKEK